MSDVGWVRASTEPVLRAWICDLPVDAQHDREIGRIKSSAGRCR